MSVKGGYKPLSLQLGDDDALRAATKYAKPSTDRIFNVVGHGNENGILFRKKLLDSNKVAHLIKNSSQYVGGKQMVVLYACETGKNPNGFAQQLSNILDVGVRAPNKLVFPTKTGGFRVVDEAYNKGKWITFRPRN